ncbi:MAG: Gx transporter family protein [Lachnospiraceae bacterium]|nr:Gx transporter family protein [Lachnospiraceae bacterium]
MNNSNNTKKMTVQKMVLLAMFSTIALTIFVIESALPPLAPIPGIKLGLANVITLILLVCFNERDALLVLFVRILLGSICAGQMMSFMYSLCGGLLCFVTMALINRLLHKQFIFITSVFGAIAHNIGQLLVAIFLVRQPGILVYLPLMMISAVLTGLFTGFCAWFTTPRLERLLKKHHMQR